MTKVEIWKDLRDQTRQARKDKNEKRNAITTCDWNEVEKSCIKVFQVQSLGVPNENQSGIEYSIRNCDNFTNEPCDDITCKFCKKNHEYTEAVAVFKALKRARNKAFWDMFVRNK